MKKFIAELFYPLSILYVLVLFAVLFALLRRSRATLLVTVPAVILISFFGYGVGVKSLIKEREMSYPPLTGKRLQDAVRLQPPYIVVLGSGHRSNPRLPATSQIGHSSLYRLVEGIRLQRLIPGSQLVLCGGAVFDPVPNALVTARVARSLGFDEQHLVLLTTPENTEQEVSQVSSLVQASPFILVTSALHMPRAMALFESHGHRPIPAPTDFIIKEGGKQSPAALFPSPANLGLWQSVVYEYLAEIWQALGDSLNSIRR